MSGPAGDPLLRGLSQGREEAFAALYDRVGPALFWVAYALLGSRTDAEDAVQEVFVGLVRARGKLAEVEDLRAYLFAALRRAAAKIAAGRPPARPVAAGELAAVAGPQPRAADLERSVRLECALRSLPPEQRELVALKVDGGLTFAEIAALLGISANTAASRYRYALEKLRAALEEG
jgi:RNA polymerase sigma-70 factor (ECF subfamily)